MKSDRNALKILGSMKEYMNIKPSPERYNENVYYLNKKGADMVGLEEEIRWVNTVEHHLMRNDLYIHYNMPESFVIEPRIKVGANTFRPDATFREGTLTYLIEVDRTQKMVENKKKIEEYAKEKQRMAGRERIIFYTLSSIRQKKLKEWADAHGLQCQVYTKDDLK